VNWALVIEDDVDVREVLGDTLTDEGYQVVTAENGAEGLAQLRGMRDPCLVLLDLLMPIMNGWEFRSRQFADPRLRDVPVIVMTATTNIPEAKIQANAFLQKPVDLDVLLRTVSQHALPRD
jgi:CheY-like chemotaxis protein